MDFFTTWENEEQHKRKQLYTINILFYCRSGKNAYLCIRNN